MDFLAARQRREWLLVSLVGLLAIGANLPPHFLRALAIEPRYLMAVLGLLVILALFLYVRFFFFLLYVLLAIGANIPEQWAAGLGISRMALIITLGIMVVLSLLNYKARLLPTGLQPPPRNRSPEGVKALLHAVEKGNLAHARAILAMNIDTNVPDAAGQTPLTTAAAQGHLPLVELLLDNGADPRLPDPQGLTAAELALKGGHTAVFERIKARQAVLASAAASHLSDPVTKLGG